MSVRLVVLLLAAGFAAACGFAPGDRAIEVTIENRLDTAVFVGRPEAEAEPRLGVRVAPNSTVVNAWLAPRTPEAERQSPPFRVEARSETGELLFCRLMTYEEIRRSGNRIEITLRNDCN